MAQTNAERQAARRERLRLRGHVHFQEWVTAAQARRLRALLTELRGGKARGGVQALGRAIAEQVKRGLR